MQYVGVDVRDDEGGALVASGMSSVILGPVNLARRPTKTFTLYNQGPVMLSGAVVQINPDRHGVEPGTLSAVPFGPPPQIGPNSGLWQTYDATAFQCMAAGEMRSLVANDVFRWWRVLGVNDGRGAATVAASGWFIASTV